MQSRTLYVLTYLAAFMSLGHHVDHVLRGNAVGWPITDEVNAFTISLGIYPLLVAGLYLYRTGRVGPGFWAVLSGGGVVFVTAIHFGPFAVERPGDITGVYQPPVLGWLAFAWLLAFVGVLVATCAYDLWTWLHQRNARPVDSTATNAS